MMAGFVYERWRSNGWTGEMQAQVFVIGACPTCGYPLYDYSTDQALGGECSACDLYADVAARGLKVLHEINGDHHDG